MIFKKQLICVLALTMLCVLFAGCSDDSSGNSSESSGKYDLSYSDRDLDASFDETSAQAIRLKDGSDVTITEEGVYIVSGVLSDGQIIVDTPDNKKVQLVLKEAEISCSDNAPILINESDKVFITLAEGSNNVLSGPETYSQDASDAGIDGVIYSKSDLCINGSGNLEISGSSHGIVSKDDLIITGGNIDVDVSGDGLQGKDCVKIKDGSFDISAENDGIKSSNSEDEERGFISVDGGKFKITAGYDGLQAETLLRIAGGNFDVTTGGGSKFSSTQEDWGGSWGGGRSMGKPGDMMPPGVPGSSESGNNSENGDSTSENSGDTISAKGLKSGLEISILGGDINMDSSDDAVHSNGDAAIKGGTLTIASGDDGIHADSELTVTSGEVTVSRSYEGLEGNSVDISGGKLDVTASDDGFNAAGGNDGSSIDDRAGQNQFAADETAFINISGGTIKINASGDGIDSNGDLIVSGGEIYLSGPENDGNGALDYAGSAKVTGGALLLAGSSGMAQNFGDSSSQCSLLYGFSTSQNAGSEVALKNSDGNTLISYTPEKSYSSVLFSCSDIVVGETYSVYVNGIKADTVTISSSITDAGNISGRGNKGPGGRNMPDKNNPPGGGNIPEQNKMQSL